MESIISDSNATKIHYLFLAFFCIIFCFVITLYPFYIITYTILFLCVVLFLSDLRLGLFYLIFAYPIIKRIITFALGSEPAYFEFYIYFLSFIILIYKNLFFQKKINIIINKIDKSLMVFIIYILFSLLMISSNMEYGILKFQYFILSIILFYLPKLFLTNHSEIIIFTKAIFLFGITLVIYGFLQLTGLVIMNTVEYTGRFTILGWNPIWIARYLSYAILIEIFMLKKSKIFETENFGKNILIVLVIAFQLYMLILTGSRGPLLGLIFGSVTFFIIQVKINFKKVVLSILVIAIIIAILGLILPRESNNRIVANDDQGKLTAAIRLLANLHAIELFIKNFTFGIGFGAYEFGGEFFEIIHYPHNIFTELIAETGIIGFLIFFYFFLSILRRFIKNHHKYNKDLVSVVISLFVAALVNANLSGHIGGNVYLWFSLGIMHYMNITIRDESIENIVD